VGVSTVPSTRSARRFDRGTGRNGPTRLTRCAARTDSPVCVKRARPGSGSRSSNSQHRPRGGPGHRSENGSGAVKQTPAPPREQP
jgi:hypothetical protein